MKLSIIILLLLPGIILSSSSTDLLDGYGLFGSDMVMERWYWINSDYYSYSLSSNISEDSSEVYNYLQLNKLDTANGAYDDGIYYFFGDTKP